MEFHISYSTEKVNNFSPYCMPAWTANVLTLNTAGSAQRLETSSRDMGHGIRQIYTLTPVFLFLRTWKQGDVKC